MHDGLHSKKHPDRSSKPARQDQQLLTLSQAQQVTGVPKNSLRDLTLRGFLPVVRLGDSRRIWLRRRDLDALIERSLESVA